MKPYCKMIFAMVFAIITVIGVHGTDVTTKNCINDLRTYSGSNNEQVSVLGYYADTPGVGGGIFYGMENSSLEDNGGTIIAVNNSTFRWIREEKGYACVDDFGARSSENPDYAEINKNAFQNAVIYVSRCGGGMAVASGGTYYLSGWTNIGASNVTLRGNQSTLKRSSSYGGNSHWLLVNGKSNFSMSEFILDGNSIPTSSSAACLHIYGGSYDIDISELSVKNANGGGIGISVGGNSYNIRLNKITLARCSYACIFAGDLNSGTNACSKILMSNIIVKNYPENGNGIIIGDNTEKVVLTNSIIDVGSSNPAIRIRGARDISITNCIGRGGSYGLYISRNGNDCKNITLAGNLWCDNNADGVKAVGIKNISIVGDISRTNGSSCGGFCFVKESSSILCKNITLSSVQAFDDRTPAQQGYGINIDGADNVRISSPLCHGNSTNIAYKTTDTKIYVSNDGAEGATRKIKTVNIEISAGGCSAIDVTWDTPFVDDNNKLTCTATMVQSTTTRSLRVHHVSDLSATKVTVFVVNDSNADCSGTLCVSAERK